MPAIAIAILQALPTVEVGVEHLVAYIQSVRAASKQSGEWTPDHETQFLNALVAHVTDPAYQTSK